MHNMADFEAQRQHREEIGWQIEGYRLGRRLQYAGPRKNPLTTLNLGRRASGTPRAAG